MSYVCLLHRNGLVTLELYDLICPSQQCKKLTHLFILLLDLCLHLLQLLLAFIWTHSQPLSQHAYTEDGKQSGGHVVCVDSRDDGGGVAKEHCGWVQQLLIITQRKMEE